MTEVTPQHTTLSGYLMRVQLAIKGAFRESSWVVAELADVKHSPKGHAYFDLIETDDGREVAKCRCTMFAKALSAAMIEWQRVTGSGPQAGMKLLIKIKPDFSPQYGFSLVAEAIDPKFTLGDMQARIQQTIKMLKARGWYDLQRNLKGPTDFWRVAVISPDGAAGLADFRRDAQILDWAGVCNFEYFTSVFQGVDTSESIRNALKRVHERHQQIPFDVACIIRGGGSKADLAWLNDEKAAAWACRLPIPIYTGIGHEIDECVLDLVAHQSFDTPSKVIGHIRTMLERKCADTRRSILKIEFEASRLIAASGGRVGRAQSDFARLSAGLVAKARANGQAASARFKAASAKAVASGRMQMLMTSAQFIGHSRALCGTKNLALHKMSAKGEERMRGLITKSWARIESGVGIYERINPIAVMARGFVLVTGAAGVPVSSAAQADQQRQVTLHFKDGKSVFHRESSDDTIPKND